MTKIIVAHELLEQGISQVRVAERLAISRRTVIRWEQAIREHGSLTAFLACYQQAKSGPRQKRKRDQVLKQRIWALREKYRHCCGQKLQYFLQQDHRSLRRECLGWAKYRPAQIPQLTQEVEDWLHYYRFQRPHLGLGMRTPLPSQV